MKVVLQRVNHASVEVGGEIVGKIDRGLCVLAGFGRQDDAGKLKPMAEKVANMRIFANDNGRFDLSTLDIEGEILAVPQFTLFADTRKGRRPDFFSALDPEEATRLFDKFVEALQTAGIRNVAAGVFGAEMKVALENDGPVTIIVEN